LGGYRVVFAPEAKWDYAQLEDFIASKAGAGIARRLVDALVEFCEGLAETPHRGSLREDIEAHVRAIGFRRAVTVVFRVDDPERRVIIVGVFYRGRDVAAEWLSATPAE
jgi:plasmid stabilization system protein ParE